MTDAPVLGERRHRGGRRSVGSRSHRLVRTSACKGRRRWRPPIMRPATNLVFLLDVSGSMNNSEEAPAASRTSLKLCSSSTSRPTGPASPSWCTRGPGGDRPRLDRPRARTRSDDHSTRSTRLARGRIDERRRRHRAWRTRPAQEHFIEGGINRVILCHRRRLQRRRVERRRARRAD